VDDVDLCPRLAEDPIATTPLSSSSTGKGAITPTHSVSIPASSSRRASAQLGSMNTSIPSHSQGSSDRRWTARATVVFPELDVPCRRITRPALIAAS
jgi:hypothetical protein